MTGSIKEPLCAFFKEPLTYDISLDRDSPLSLVRQLSDSLRERILDGRLTAGSKVPSTRDAAAGLSVARNVVLEAYEQLEAEGYLEGIAGSGTRVADIAGADRSPGRRAAGKHATADRRSTASDRAIAAHGPTGSPRAITVDFATACGVPEPSVFPVAAWKRCVAASASEVALDGLSFPDARGHERLREELAALVYRSRGIECEPERIFVTRGTTHALSLVARYLRPRSSRAVIEDPMLNSFRRLLARFSYDVECVPVDDAGLRVDSLRAFPRARAGKGRDGMDARGCLAVVTPSHQFPSGVILPVSRRLELLDFAASLRGWVFEDDYDGELRLRGVPVPPVLCLDPSRVFYAGTFNKTLYPALRLGYLIVPEREVEPFAAMIRAYAEWPETLASGALAAFIGEGAYERHLRTLRKLYARRRAALAESVARHLGDAYTVKGSEAGCHCRLSPVRTDPAHASSRRIDRDLALANGVAVAEVAHYIAARPSGRNGLDPREGPAPSFRDDLLLGYGNLDETAIARGIASLARSRA